MIYIYIYIYIYWIISPISNEKLLKCITELTSKVDNLSNIDTYQTKLIQEFKTDKTNLKFNTF